MRRNVTRRRGLARLGAPAVLLSVVLGAAACGSGSSGTSAAPSASASGSAASSSAPHRGGSLTVLEGKGFAGDWPAGLDPATNTNGDANQSMMHSIYGQLFELNAKSHIVNDLASGHHISADGTTVTVDIRKGVTFTDGTPFNAQAVVFNIKRDLKSPCTCKPTWPVASVTASGSHTVVIKLKRPFAAVFNSWIDSNVNWIASPTALKKMGEKKFKVTPVGAGPFEVVSDTLSSQLVLKKNPNYWKKGHPYLDQLTFKTVGGDEAAYEAMLSKQGQVYEGLSTPSLIPKFKQHFAVTRQLATSAYDIQFNTQIPPFNNIKAREAIYYATDIKPIVSHIFDNLYPLTESFTGPGGICYEPKVPGYRNYDLAKAKSLVKQLGGLTVNLGTISVLVAKETTQALQTEWKKAGIKATIHNYPLAGLIQKFQSHKWQAMVQTAGAYDPAAGVGVSFRFASNSPFSGVKDPHLDKLLNEAAATLNRSDRCKLYHQAAAYINQKAYGPFFFAVAPENVTVKGVRGPGLTIPLSSVALAPDIPWEDVSYNPAG